MDSMTSNQKVGANPSNPGGRFNFTEAAIARLPIPEPGTRMVYRDTAALGLQLRITSNGVKTFSIFRRIKGGQPERITLDRCPPMTVKAARDEAAKANAMIAARQNPAEVRRAVKGELTFRGLFDAYLDLHAKSKKRTWREDEANYRRYLAGPLGGRKVSQITRAHLTAIHDRITRDGHLFMANRVLALASKTFSWGIAKSRCEENPARGIERNNEKPFARDRFLKADELPRFFAALADEPNKTMRDYFLLSLLTGARRSNVLAMRWQDLNLDSGEWRIERTKNEDPATVALTAEAITILRERKPDDDDEGTWVFPGPGKRGHLAEPRKGWERIFDRDELTQLKALLSRAGISLKAKAGENLPTTVRRARTLAEEAKLNTTGTRLADLRIHDLRRTLGSWQAKTGASLVIIGKSLSHKTPSATAVYARLDLDPVRASVERATSAMLKAAGVKNHGEVVALPNRKRAT